MLPECGVVVCAKFYCQLLETSGRSMLRHLYAAGDTATCRFINARHDTMHTVQWKGVNLHVVHARMRCSITV